MTREMRPTLSRCWSVGASVLTQCCFIVAASTTGQLCDDQLQACRCVVSMTTLEIDCSSCGLTSIPADIPANTNILNLSGNRITSIQAGVFQRLKNLTSLDLSYNTITELNSESLRGLETLKYLNLNGNSISYDAGYAPGSLKAVDRLEKLQLQTDPCPIVYPNLLISGLIHLRELSIQIPAQGSLGDAMGNLTNLDSLFLTSSCSELRKLTAEDVRSLYSTPLRRLSLRSARLNHVDPDALQGFNKTLKKLDISCNSISNVPEVISGLMGVKLDTLLADSSVSEYTGLRLTSQTLAALQAMNLTVLTLSNNLLISFDLSNTVITKLEPTNIKYLRIGYNQGTVNIYQITDLIPIVPFLFKLQVLDGNGLLHFYDSDDAITNCGTEDDLFTDDVKEWELDPIVYPAPNMPLWLWSILVIFRRLHSGLITAPPLLTRIYAKELGLKAKLFACQEPDGSMFEKNNIRLIDATGIRVSKINCEPRGFQLLEVLSASQMHLERFNPSFFSNSTAPRLAWLDLSFNNLGSFFEDSSSKPLENVVQVKYLDLSFNGIRQIHNGLFDHCESLTTLNLSGNMIEHWSASVSNLKSLVLLNLSGNPLNPIDKVYLDQFDELRELYNLRSVILSNITCSCNFEFMMWLHTTKILLPDITCSSSSVFSNYLPSTLRLLWTCTGVYVVSALCCVLITTVFCITFKWRLRYAFYKLKHYFNRNNQCWPLSDVRVYLAYHQSEHELATLVQQFLSERMDIRNVVCRNKFSLGASEYDQVALHIDSSQFVVLIASRLTTADPKSDFELQISFQKGTSHILPILAADFTSYDELPRMLKKLLCLNNHLLWRRPAPGTTDLQDEHEKFFKYFKVLMRSLLDRQYLFHRL